jgi:hypothetical protein
MFSRITLLTLALFWLTMTYLLWRSEYVGQKQVGTSVPVELVWRKILTAPDNSGLEIRHHKQKVGYCRLASNVGQELAMGKFLNDALPPDASTANANGYRLNLEGNVALNETPGRLKFDLEIKMSTNRVWQELDLQVRMKPSIWQIHSRASDETVSLVSGGPEGRTERIYKFADLQNPVTLMQEFDVPAPVGLLGMLGTTPQEREKNSLALGLDWTARNDWIAIGHTSVRDFRLEASLLDRYRVIILVSPVGEILHVYLPDEWELVNDQIPND